MLAMKHYKYLALATLAVALFGIFVVQRTGKLPSECPKPTGSRIPPIQIKPVVKGLYHPNYVTHANDGSGQLFVVERAGTVRVVKEGRLLPTPFLDISEHVFSPDSDPPSATTEQGFLSIVFHPNYSTNRRFFVNYTAIPDGRTIVAEYVVSPGATVANPKSRRVILEVAQPGIAHNGGLLKFGKDGYLYIGMGDGSDMPGFERNAQDLGSLLGKILRIDVNKVAPYVIPSDNPFRGKRHMRPEIFAYGFRNPWRFSFDRCDGTLFLGDVGSYLWEEVNLVIKEGNYGWPYFEGNECRGYEKECKKTSYQSPISVYDRPLDENGEKGTIGAAVIGGYVYRGKRFPQLSGYYFFTDYFSRTLWTLTESEEKPHRWERQVALKLGFSPSSFGEGEDGELYITGYDGTLHQIVQGMAP